MYCARLTFGRGLRPQTGVRREFEASSVSRVALLRLATLNSQRSKPLPLLITSCVDFTPDQASRCRRFSIEGGNFGIRRAVPAEKSSLEDFVRLRK